MTTVPGHSAIVGITDRESTAIGDSQSWSRSVSHSGSRTSANVRQSSRPPLLVAYRGGNQGFFQDDSYTIMVDGCIDNLRDSVDSTHATDCTDASTQAELVARMFARDGHQIFVQFTGSFALAIVTHDSGEVLLARDRFGTKPLFYAATPRGWMWASEVKCLCPLLDRVAADPEGLRQAIHYRYMIGRTLIEGVTQVMPASFVRLVAGRPPIETHYWQLAFQPSPENYDLDYWAGRVDTALDASFARLSKQYRDVGILLSGGVDSSLLALKAARSGFRTCVALTARLPGDNPELEWATAVARHLGIEHQIVDVDESYIKQAFPWLVWRMEEPPRHYNSFVLSKLFETASTRVEVLLNGHTADAMFGPQACIAIDKFRRRHSQLTFVPRFLRKRLAAQLPENGSLRVARLKNYLQIDEHEFAGTFFTIDYDGLGDSVFGLNFRPTGSARRALQQFYDPLEPATERFQRFDIYTFNQSHMAVFDRLSAPFGIAINLPFLSPELVNVALELPSCFKADGEIAKPVLKRLAARYFPKDWIYREKQGFPTQISSWLDGQLGQWRRLLSEERTASRGILNLNELRSAVVGRQYEAIWTSMSLEMFYRQFIDGDGGPDSSGTPTAGT